MHKDIDKEKNRSPVHGLSASVFIGKVKKGEVL